MKINNSKIEKWGTFELSLKGPESRNSFSRVQLSAIFKNANNSIEVNGFYNGNGMYIIRFMPDETGKWTYQTNSNSPELKDKSGSFECIKPSPTNHGPVNIYNTYHFRYTDNTPFFPVGTTCYAWIHQGNILEEQTLQTLKNSPFNKVRMCVFPKHMEYNDNEPEFYPFEKDKDGNWDFKIFNPDFFTHLEKRVHDLLELGIESDIIIFHPYDKGHWGFDSMGRENDTFYLKYLISRLSAYRNVWWSLANEFDLMAAKTIDDWDYYFQFIQENDPYNRLRSVHNWGTPSYDYSKPWVTHCSYQTPVTSRGIEEVPPVRENNKKATIVDECLYEGNIEMRWGNITPQEMVHRFWLGTVAGCYVTHGETYTHPEDILWWSKGGKLYGQSTSRIAFLKKVLEDGPQGIEPIKPWPIWRKLTAGIENEYYLLYLSFHQPVFVKLKLPEGIKFHVDIIDTWEMIVTPINKEFEGKSTIELPGKQYLALRIKKI